MEFNTWAKPEEFAVVGRLLGADTLGLEAHGAAEKAVRAVEKLKADIGIPERLRDIGVTEDQLRPFAEKAAGVKRILRVNPRPVTVDDLEAILRSAY